MIFHIPHASDSIPDEHRSSIILNDNDLSSEILQITDAYTDELFGSLVTNDDKIVQFPVSRLVLDPERFLDDSEEVMAKVGMGVVYTRTSEGRPLRPFLDPPERESLIDQYYHPHHAKLTNAISHELSEFGYAQIIDCHSFPSRPLPYELDQNPDRPDICIGTDKFHTPTKMVEKIVSSLTDKGLTVSINSPFSGTIVPLDHYQANKYVFSIMIEINRKLYMDETTGEKTGNFSEMEGILNDLIPIVRRYGWIQFLDHYGEDCKARRIKTYPWNWAEGKINKDKPHFLLKYGDLNKVETKDLFPVALVSRHMGCKVHVEFILDKTESEYEAIRAEAEREINFYLVELKERNPLAYLVYHCNTTSNFYSNIHWVRSGRSRRKD